MITFICWKIKFSIFDLLSILKLIKLKKSQNKLVVENKVVMEIKNKKVKQNDLTNQKFI